MIRRVVLRLFPTSSTAILLRLCLVAGLSLGVVSALPAAAAANAYAPVATYSFDEGSGETVEDVTGDGHTATIHGAKWTTHGRYGGAMEFDAAEHDYLSIPASEELDNGEELTVEAWVRPTENPAYYASIAMKEREGPGPGYSWTLDQHETEANGFFMQTEEGMVAGGPYSLPLDTWTHVALTDDGAHNRLYVDGQLVDTEPAIPFDGHGPIKIGGNALFGQWFDGRIDELRIYDRALGQAEVAYDMEAPILTPKKTPVAAYSFDEGEGSTLHDVTGDGHDGTIEGATWARGRYGDSLEFDSSGHDVVKIPDSPELDFSEEFTLEAWVRPDSTSEEWAPAIAKGAGEGESSQHPAYSLWAAGAEHDHPLVAIKPVAGPESYVQSGQALPAHAWSHIAFVYDGSDMHVYVDGEEVNDAPSGYPTITGGDLEIGGAGALGEYFDGRIDEVRIYNRALNSGEVGTDMEAPIATPKQGPVAAYSFDEGGPGVTTVEDDTGHGHTATIEGGAEWTKGRYGGALHFYSEGDCATVPDSPELRLSEEFTLEAWVWAEGGLYEDPIVVREAGGKGVFGLGIGSREPGEAEGFIGEGKGSKAAVGAGDGIREDEWVHLATTWDGATIRLYVDGELAASKAATTPPGTGEGSLHIGCDGPDGPFGGRIDEVRVYDRALDGGEVDSDMEAPLQTPKATPVASYSFDEGEGENVSDTTGDGHTATVEGAAWTTHGRYGGAMEFDASKEDVLKIPASPELDFGEEFTLEAWVRPSGATNKDAPLIDKQAAGHRGYFLYEGGKVSDRPYGAVSEEQEYVHAEDPLPADAWSHVALTFTGNRSYLYVDGELVDNGAAEPFVDPEGELEIGGSTDTSDFFDGRIDEVRIYNRGLDPAEVVADMEAPIQTPKQGPVAAWTFDEGEGTTAEDITGDGHTATIEGATLARGKYGEALQFDGEDDCVSVVESEDLRFDEEFTLEAWVRPDVGSPAEEPIIVQEDEAAAEGEEPYAYALIGGGEASAAGWVRITGEHEYEGIYGDGPLPEAAWTHIALTDDGAHLRLYEDGELVREVAAPVLTTAQGPLTIGCDKIFGAYFRGRIDEVRVYNRALNEAEAIDVTPPYFQFGQALSILNLPEEPIVMIPAAVDPPSPAGKPGTGVTSYRYRYGMEGALEYGEWDLTEAPYISIPEGYEGQTLQVEVQAVDGAGNRSQPLTGEFEIPEPESVPPVENEREFGEEPSQRLFEETWRFESRPAKEGTSADTVTQLSEGEGAEVEVCAPGLDYIHQSSTDHSRVNVKSTITCYGDILATGHLRSYLYFSSKMRGHYSLVAESRKVEFEGIKVDEFAVASAPCLQGWYIGAGGAKAVTHPKEAPEQTHAGVFYTLPTYIPCTKFKDYSPPNL
jgi:Concanavalin A-like lectin/glucanases superfamily